MKHYTAGFLFSNSLEHVALIRKERPDWQAGRLNGIGGHVEEGETPVECQIREFKEETGVDYRGWREFCTYLGPNYRVKFFVGISDEVYKVETKTDETVIIMECDEARVLGEESMIYNLRWLLSLAIDPCVERAAIWGT